MVRCRAGGFGMVEVLVAVLLLALAVTGGAAMQLAALRTRHQSALLSNAVQTAADMAERIRANPGQTQADGAANPYLRLDYDAAVDPSPSAPAQSCAAPDARCDSAQLASADLYDLKQHIGATLPGGRVVICRDATAWQAGRAGLGWQCAAGAASPLVIKIGWRGKNPDGSPARDGARAYPPQVALTLRAARR